jgi:hypothetical protein
VLKFYHYFIEFIKNIQIFIKKLFFGVKGFEPLNARIKNERLTTWLYPKDIYFVGIKKILNNSQENLVFCKKLF